MSPTRNIWSKSRLIEPGKFLVEAEKFLVAIVTQYSFCFLREQNTASLPYMKSCA